MPDFMLSNFNQVQSLSKITRTKTIIDVIGSFHVAIHIPSGLRFLSKTLTKKLVIKT